jgi:hypothetical protein
LASKKSFQRHFPQRKTWENVRRWNLEQDGTCVDCGNRLELQADHVISRQTVAKIGREIIESGEVLSPENANALKEKVGSLFTKEIKGSRDHDKVSDELQQMIGSDVVALLLEGIVETKELALGSFRLPVSGGKQFAAEAH